MRPACIPFEFRVLFITRWEAFCLLPAKDHDLRGFISTTQLRSNYNSVMQFILRRCCKWTAMATRFQGRSMRSQIILMHDMYLPLKEYGTFFNSRCIIENLPSSDFKFIFQISKQSLLAMIPTWSPF